MKETDLQSKVVDSIREMGGFAQKCSNRFLIGVPDVLCQLPGFQASFWEVKKSPSKWQMPNPTPKQKQWLRDFTRAGGFGGVIYFMGNVNDIIVGIKPAGCFNLGDLTAKWRIEEDGFVVLPRGCKMIPFKEELLRVHQMYRREQDFARHDNH